ncbi:MAG: UDP-3-O-acyl-N-acetylglucosamine deacetylase [Planctomyces sp.]|nr:UDP-3-O-acyl-N-acetylglucosamine deacetylase [Planctomyces sp.]
MDVARQRTIAQPAEVTGFGLFHGQDCRLTFRPAPPGHGLAFRRADLPGSPVVPATIEHLQPAPRRTVLAQGGAQVETVEHVLAALAGLWIDNCLVELTAVEPPIGDGSSLAFVEALRTAGVVEQPAPANIAKVDVSFRSGDPLSQIQIDAEPADGLEVRYDLDYGSPLIPPQSVACTVTPQRFMGEIAFARTFILDSEVDGLKALGFGRRVTTDNLLVIGPRGPLGNVFRSPDECARHKLLDAIGDWALCGARVQGRFHAVRSGHSQNHELAARLRSVAASRRSGTASPFAA